MVHVRDETIVLSGLPTGAAPSAHVVDPPVPRPGAAGGGDGNGPVRDRRPASRSVRVLVATAAATLVAAAAVAVVIGALVVDGPDAVVVAAAQLAILIPAVAVAVTLLAMVRNRLRDQVDEPVAELRQVAAAVLDGDLTARTGRAGPTDVGAAEELDAAVGSVQCIGGCASTPNGALRADDLEALDLPTTSPSPTLPVRPWRSSIPSNRSNCCSHRTARRS